MKTSASIHVIRNWLKGAITVGLALGIVGLFVGMNIPGMVAGAVGWALVIACIVWLVNNRRQYASSASRAQNWRPGDEDSPS